MDLRSVSLIIPSHNRVALLCKALRAIEAQIWLPEQFEVVVVLDGCEDYSLAAVKALATKFPIRCFELPGLGPASARNFGAEQAKGTLLVFLDDDVEPGPTFVQAHVAAHEAADARTLVLGPYPPVASASPDLFRQLQAAWWRDHFSAVAAPGHRFTYRDVLAGNLSLPKSLWDRIGGLDPSFRRAREDIEFGMRVVASGLRITYAPAAHAAHHEAETMSLKGALRRAYEEGYSDVLLGRKHPKLQDQLEASWRGDRNGALARAARRGSSLGGMLAHILERVLPAIGARGFRHVYVRWFREVTNYWYARGCLAHKEAREGGPDRQPSLDGPRASIVLELSDGLERAEADLDTIRPERADLQYRGAHIGELPYEPGAEAWAARHLRPYLTEHCGPALIAAMAEAEDIEGLSGSHAQRVVQRARKILYFHKARNLSWSENAFVWAEFEQGQRARLSGPE